MSIVHSGQEAVIPTCAAVLIAALLLTGCEVAEDKRPFRTAGFAGDAQIWEERATGCLFVSSDGGRFTPRPILRVDGFQAGCRLTTAPSNTQPGTQPGLPGEVKQSPANQEQGQSE